jgi:carbon storage regulator CsrA
VLVLSRRPKEELYFPDISMVIRVLAVKGSAVSLGIEAPPQIKVLRSDLRPRPASTQGVGQPAEPKSLVRKALRFDSLLRYALAGVEAARAGLEAGPVEDVKTLLKTMQEDLTHFQQLLSADARCASATLQAAARPDWVPAAIEAGSSEKSPPTGPARARCGNSVIDFVP